MQNSYSSDPHRAKGDFTHAVTIRPSDGATDGLTDWARRIEIQISPIEPSWARGEVGHV